MELEEKRSGGSIEIIEVTEFDSDYLAAKLKKTKEAEVKLFVNTKNSRRKEQSGREEDLQSVSTSRDVAPFSKEEIYFLGKENI